jgi:hypothetical protein
MFLDRRCCTTEMHGIDCWPIKINRDDPFYSKLKDRVNCNDLNNLKIYIYKYLQSKKVWILHDPQHFAFLVNFYKFFCLLCKILQVFCLI